MEVDEATPEEWINEEAQQAQDGALGHTSV